jgi:hypothetical protein
LRTATIRAIAGIRDINGFPPQKRTGKFADEMTPFMVGNNMR